jgi:hypothetical protein
VGVGEWVGGAGAVGAAQAACKWPCIGATARCQSPNKPRARTPASWQRRCTRPAAAGCPRPPWDPYFLNPHSPTPPPPAPLLLGKGYVLVLQQLVALAPAALVGLVHGPWGGGGGGGRGVCCGPRPRPGRPPPRPPARCAEGGWGEGVRRQAGRPPPRGARRCCQTAPWPRHPLRPAPRAPPKSNHKGTAGPPLERVLRGYRPEVVGKEPHVAGVHVVSIVVPNHLGRDGGPEAERVPRQRHVRAAQRDLAAGGVDAAEREDRGARRGDARGGRGGRDGSDRRREGLLRNGEPAELVQPLGGADLDLEAETVGRRRGGVGIGAGGARGAGRPGVGGRVGGGRGRALARLHEAQQEAPPARPQRRGARRERAAGLLVLQHEARRDVGAAGARLERE